MHTTDEVLDGKVVGPKGSPLNGVLLTREIRLIFNSAGVGVDPLALHGSELLGVVNVPALASGPLAFRRLGHRTRILGEAT